MLGYFIRPKAHRSTESGPYSVRDPALWGLLGLQRKTTTGVVIDEDRVNGIAAYWCAKNTIANSIKSLPCGLYQKQSGKRRTQIHDHPAARLMSGVPNPNWTQARFKQASMLWRFDWGNFCAEIERSNSGKPLRLWPIHTSRVCRMWNAGKMFYRVFNNNGKPEDIQPEDMLHFMFVPWWDGTWGISLPGVARESFGLTVTADEYGAKYFANSAVPAVVVTTNAGMEKPERDAFRQEWAEIYGGNNQGGVAIVGSNDGAADVKTINGVPAKDAQFIELRVHQVQEMARWALCPVHKLKDMQNAHYNNIEHSQIEYSTDTVMPHAIEMEEELTRKLLTPREIESGMYFAFNMEGMLRGDQKTRYEAYSVGINNGSMLRDEARALEDRDPLPDGIGAMATVQAGVTSLKRVIDGTADEPSVPPDEPPEPPTPDDSPDVTDPARAAQMDAAFRSLLTSTIERLSRIEREKVAKAMKRANDFPVWRESFLVEHGARVREEVGALVTARRLAIGADDDSEAVAGEYMTRLGTLVRGANPEAIGLDNQWIFDRLLPEEN